MKTLALLLTLTAAFLLAACESSGHVSSTSTEPRGTPVGDSNVHVSGTIQAGASVTNH